VYPPTHQAPDDPIRYPRRPGAANLHQFFGNRGAKASSTYRSMLESRTSCRTRADKAGYWVRSTRAGSRSRPPIFRIEYPVGAETGEITLASGGSWTVHGDFWNTWKQPALDRLVARCLRADEDRGTKP